MGHKKVELTNTWIGKVSKPAFCPVLKFSARKLNLARVMIFKLCIVKVCKQLSRGDDFKHCLTS